MDIEDYLYTADCALSDEEAGAAARRQYPDSEILQALIKQAQQKIRAIYTYLQATTSRRCP